MRHTFFKFTILALVFNFFSCCQKVPNYVVDYDKLNWKNLATERLLKEYVLYKKQGFRPNDSCYHTSLDLYYKISDINRYSFGHGMKVLKKEIESRKINFDSIVSLTIQTSRSIDPEYLYPNYFHIFKNGKLVEVLIFDQETFNLSKSEDDLFNLEEMFLKDSMKNNGDDLSLLILTKININWEFEISKIVINSY